ncbi:MAG: sigma-70 family RNA polymerase sigma factor [Aquimonas sp.]|nr:sigma-70 family RNA polymerase sigma factor [Aquimonas sp.]
MYAVLQGLNPVRDEQRIYDEFLVAAAATGDRAALQRLVARWQPRLLRHAWRVLDDAELARDMVQESWVEILRGLGGLDDFAAFPAWACRIVSRRCYRVFNRSARQPFEAEEAGLLHEPAIPDHTTAEFASDLETVMAAVRALPPAQRAALALFHLEGMGVAEIAVALDVPPGTVKTRLMHARRKVRAKLEGAGDGQV